MNYKKRIIKSGPPLLILAMVFGFCAWPFIKHPPSHRHDKRLLLHIHAQTRRDIHDQKSFLVGRKGPVLYDKTEIMLSESADCPFIWYTSPPSGDKIQILDPIKYDRDDPPIDFVVRFYVAARDADWFGGRWILLNTGEPKYVKDSQIDWDTQTIDE